MHEKKNCETEVFFKGTFGVFTSFICPFIKNNNIKDAVYTLCRE